MKGETFTGGNLRSSSYKTNWCTDCLSSGEIPVSLHHEAELTKELLEVVDVQPGARPVGVELRSQEGLVVDQQGAAPEKRKL